MEIAVCEDNVQDLERLSAALAEYAEAGRMNITITRYANSDDFLRRLTEEGVPDISFLDIYMSSHSGVELARAIRKKCQSAVIVFVTRSPEYMAEGFAVGAVHYLLKPWTASHVEQAMSRALQITGAPVKLLGITAEHRKELLHQNLILFLEVRDKYCHIFMADGKKYITREKLSALAERLDDSCFIWCHRSFIVNMDYVKALEKNDFVLSDGRFVPIRVGGKTEIAKQYEAYRFSRIRRFL